MNDALLKHKTDRDHTENMMNRSMKQKISVTDLWLIRNFRILSLGHSCERTNSRWKNVLKQAEINRVVSGQLRTRIRYSLYLVGYILR